MKKKNYQPTVPAWARANGETLGCFLIIVGIMILVGVPIVLVLK